MAQKPERHVGNVCVDSAQILILAPENLGSEEEYQRVVTVSNEQDGGEVWLREHAIEVAPDGVVVPIGVEGNFPVYVTYSTEGEPTSIRIDLTQFM